MSVSACRNSSDDKSSEAIIEKPVSAESPRNVSLKKNTAVILRLPTCINGNKSRTDSRLF